MNKSSKKNQNFLIYLQTREIISVCLIPQSVIYNNFSSNLIYSKPTEYNIVTLVRNTPEWNYGNGIKNGYGSNVDICEHIKNTVANVQHQICYTYIAL